MSDPFEDAPKGIHFYAQNIDGRHVIHLNGDISRFDVVNGWHTVGNPYDAKSQREQLARYMLSWKVRDSSIYEDPFLFGPVGIHLKSKNKKRGYRRLRVVALNGDIYQWDASGQKWILSWPNLNGDTQKENAAGYGSDHWFALISSTYAKETTVQEFETGTQVQIRTTKTKGLVSKYSASEGMYRVKFDCGSSWYYGSELEPVEEKIEVGDTVRTLVGKVTSTESGYAKVHFKDESGNSSFNTINTSYLELVEKGNEPIVGQQYVTTTGAIYLYLEDGRVAVILDSKNAGNEGKIFNRPLNYRTWVKV